MDSETRDAFNNLVRRIEFRHHMLVSQVTFAATLILGAIYAYSVKLFELRPPDMYMLMWITLAVISAINLVAAARECRAD